MNRVQVTDCFVFITVALASACIDQSSSPLVSDAPTLTVAGAVQVPRDVPAVDIGIPPTIRPWEESDQALSDAIARADGVVGIGFKEAASARARLTGERAAVSATTIAAGTTLLTSLGADLLVFNDLIGGVVARVDPSLASYLRSHPFIDFIEPKLDARAALTLSATGTLGLAAAPPGFQDWGLTLIQADDAWSYGTGSVVVLVQLAISHEQGRCHLPQLSSNQCGGRYGGCDDGPVYIGNHYLGVTTARGVSASYPTGAAYGIGDNSVWVIGSCKTEDVPEEPELFLLTCDHFDAANAVASAATILPHGGVISLHLLQTDYISYFANTISQAHNQPYDHVIVAGGTVDSTGFAYPSFYNHVVGVSGVDPTSTWGTSNPCGSTWQFGDDKDLAAPFWARNHGSGGELITWCGEWVSASYVAAAALIVRSAVPSWKNYDVEDALFTNADDKGPAGWDQKYGWGVVDACAAIPGCGTTPPPVASISPPGEAPPYTECSWIGSASGGAGGPYTFDWYWDGTWFMSGENVWRDVGAPGYHELKLIVDDGVNTDTEIMTVDVFDGAEWCGV